MTWLVLMIDKVWSLYINVKHTLSCLIYEWQANLDIWSMPVIKCCLCAAHLNQEHSFPSKLYFLVSSSSRGLMRIVNRTEISLFRYTLCNCNKWLKPNTVVKMGLITLLLVLESYNLLFLCHGHCSKSPTCSLTKINIPLEYKVIALKTP